MSLFVIHMSLLMGLVWALDFDCYEGGTCYDTLLVFKERISIRIGMFEGS